MVKTYLLKGKKDDMPAIIDFLTENDGSLEYTSPILPILGINMSEALKLGIEDKFQLDYIIESPTGHTLDHEGSVSSVQGNTVQIVPSLNFSQLRNGNNTYMGWGSTVAVLDSGVSESWVTDHSDFTGFGSSPVLDHGTKVANIIKKAAPGSKIMSFKITHEGQVKGIHALAAIDQAAAKADIINMSFGFDVDCTPEKPCTFCETVNAYTQNNNNLFIAAAGNHGREDSIQCPGKAQEAITVGSIKSFSKDLADYSSRGVAGVKKPNILTSGSIYFNKIMDNGTSFSTPIVTGVSAALFDSLGKNMAKLKSHLYSSADDIGLPEHHQGFGLLNLENLLEVVSNDQSYNSGEGQEQS